MPLTDTILDNAYDIYEEFGPNLRTPRSNAAAAVVILLYKIRVHLFTACGMTWI
jgi:hypothetical protein